MQIAKTGDIVAIDFIVRTNDGTVVGDTKESGPQVLTIGDKEIFPQIEAALDGMTVGAVESVTIAAEDAYGARREELVIDIPRQDLPPEPEPQPGMALQAQAQDGSPMMLVLLEVNDEMVSADGNHPLAGEDLTFGLTLVEIREVA